MFKVISFGEILVDMLSNKLGGDVDHGTESFTKFPGGAPANVAAAVARLGGNAYFAGKISNDMFGVFLSKSLIEMGVKTDCVTYTNTENTALAFVSLDETGERSFEFYRDNSADLNFNQADFKSNWFGGNGIFHCCSNTLTTNDIFEVTMFGLWMAKKAGWIVSFDVNLRKNLWTNTDEASDRIWQCLAICDLIKLSKEELVFLSDGNDESQIIKKMLKNGCALVIVTDGNNLVHYHMKSGSSTQMPPKADMVDSTAAGDAFVGGFLYSLAKNDISSDRLHSMEIDNEVLAKSIKLACDCGAFAVTKKGAFTALANFADILEFLRNRVDEHKV